MSPAASASPSELALTPAMWSTTSVRATSEIGEHWEVVRSAHVEGPRAMRCADGSARVDRVQLLGRPVGAPQSVCQLHELGVVRRGADPAPQLQARWPEG